MNEINEESVGKFDIFIVKLSKDSKDSAIKLGVSFEDYAEDSDSDEVLIAKGVNYTQVRHIKKILEKNSVSFAVKIHENDGSADGDKPDFVARNIALLESLYSAETYKPSGADGFYFFVIIFAFLLLCANVIYTCSRSDTELHRAVKRQDEAKVEHILSDQPYRVYSKDSFGRTALYYINGKLSFRIAEILLDNGADINTKDKYGKTPIDYLKESEETVEARTVYLLSTYKKE